MNVMAWADQQIEQMGDFPALVEGERQYTSLEAHQFSARLAGSWLQRGLLPGQVVLLRLANGVDLVLLFTAVLRAGGVAVVVPPELPTPEVEHWQSQLQARWLVEEMIPPGELLETPVPRHPEDPAQICLTSGTTGPARAVTWSHGQVARRYLPFGEKRLPRAPRPALGVLPLSASFGAQYLYLRLLQKMQLVLLPTFEPRRVMEEVRRRGIQTAMLVPSMCEALLAVPEGDLKPLKSVLVGGARVSDQLVERFRRRFNIGLTTVYGMTELGPVARSRPGGSSSELDLSGSRFSARIVSPRGVPQDIGQVGQIQLLSEEHPQGFETGDLGFLDDQGRLHCLGRAGDSILQGGMTLYPEPIEELLRGCPGVDEAAVVGVPDAYLGEQAVVYLVGEASAEQVLEFLARHLEPRRSPLRVRHLAQLPRNSSGKLLRSQLRKLPVAPPVAVAPDRTRFEVGLAASFGTLVGGRLQPTLPWRDQGLDSLAAVMLANRLGDLLGREMSATVFFNHPTPQLLLEHLFPEPACSNLNRRGMSDGGRGEPLALIGWSCRLPGVSRPEDLWQAFLAGTQSCDEIRRWSFERIYSPRPGRGRTYVRRASMLELEAADAEFWGMTPQELEQLDPAHQLVLEVCWEALERAGYAPRSADVRDCGLYLGMSPPASLAPAHLPAMAAGRVGHCLHLQGPAMVVDTTCSSALAALDTAGRALNSGQCSMALVGGVQVIASPRSWVDLCQLRVLSPDGRCKPFEARADGFGRGEGCLMMVLKPLSQARADGDAVLAVVLGSGLNQDGLSSSLTAPNGQAQLRLMQRTLQQLQLRPEELSYQEAHGTGTVLGDAVEWEALSQLREGCPIPLPVGSAKANFGHLEAASGALGLLKAALVLAHGRVPAQPDFGGRARGLSGEALRIPSQAEPLPGEGPWVAGVLSLGMSGTNAYAVLQSVPPAGPPQPDPQALVCLSAPHPESLSRLQAEVERLPPSRELSYTLMRGRQAFAYRSARVGEWSLQGQAQAGQLAWLFSGQGSLYPGAGLALMDSEPVFAGAWQYCEQLCPGIGLALEQAQGPLLQAAQVALQWSLARLWQSWGVTPGAVLGHSLGELSAACVAGLISLEQALPLARLRGQRMAPLGGGMLGVEVEAEPLQEVLGEELALACRNAARHCVVSGMRQHLESLTAELDRRGWRWAWLPVSTAFHSHLIEPVMDELGQALGEMTFGHLGCDFYSSRLGRLATREELARPEYWLEGMRYTVEFASAADSLLERAWPALLEVGAHPQLLGLLPAQGAGQLRVASLRRGESPTVSLRKALGQLFVAGQNPDWVGYWKGREPGRMALPTTPFRRRQSAPEAVAAGLWNEVEAVLGVSPDPQRSLLEQGVDSLRAVELLGRLQDRLGLQVDPTTLLTSPDWSGLLGGRGRGGWCGLRSGSGGPGWILLPPAGGQWTCYLQLLSRLKEPTWALQLEPPLESLEAPGLAAAWVDQLWARGVREAVFYGWSLGGWLAHLTARAFEARGGRVRCVAMVDPPGLQGPDLDPDVLALAGWLGDFARPGLPWAHILEVSRLASPAQRLQECQRRGWLAAGRWRPEAFAERLDFYRQTLGLLSGLVPRPVSCPVLVGWAQGPPPDWQPEVLGSAGVLSQVLGGDHYSVMQSPRCERFLQEVFRVSDRPHPAT